MKKIIAIVIIFFSIMPQYKNGQLSFFQISETKGQSNGTALPVLANYLVNKLNIDANLLTAGPANCNCIHESGGNGTGIKIHYISEYQQNSTFKTWVNTNYPNYLPLDEHPDKGNGNENGDEQNENEDDLGSTWLLDEMRDNSNNYITAMDLFYLGFGYEGSGPNTQTPNCDPALGNTSEELEYLQSEGRRTQDYSGSFGYTQLNCPEKFLIGNKIISFTGGLQNGISSYHYSGSTLIAVTYNGKKYYNVVDYKFTNKKIRTIYPDNYCPEFNVEYVAVDNATTTYKFICTENLDALLQGSIDGIYNGIKAYPSRLPNGGTTITYINIPDNLQDVSFTIPAADVTTAIAGNIVRGRTSAGVEYCEEITAEDIEWGNTKDRDTKYIPQDINFHLEHPINIPGWIRKLLEIFPDISLDDCVVNKVNDKLDALHQKASYTTLPTESNKKMAEYKALAYHIAFSFFYCQTNEEAVKNLNCGGQIFMGMLNELLNSVDVEQMEEGLLNIVKGLGNMVQQNVNNVIDGVKDAAENEVTFGFGNFDYERFTKFITERNIQNAGNFFHDASVIATKFSEMYFTQCDVTPVPAGSTSTFDLCCYRKGQLTMMILPIVLTAGDYAVVKLTGLAAKYGNRARRAAEVIKNAISGNKSILYEWDNVLNAPKTVIKEPATNNVVAIIKKEEEILDGTTVLDKQLVVTEADNLLSGAALNDLAAVTPNSRNLSKSKFHSNAHKVDKDITPDLKTKVEDIIVNGDNVAGSAGAKTEAIQDILFKDKSGYNKLDGKYNGGSDNGIDGLFIEGTVQNPTKIIINECKQWDGASGVMMNAANQSSGLPVQMSHDWIQYVAGKLRQTGNPDKIAIGDMLLNNPNLIEKYVTVVNKITGDINILRLGFY